METAETKFETVTEHGLIYLLLAGIRLPLPKESLREAMMSVKSLDRASLESLVHGLEFKTHPDLEMEPMQIIVSSYVQNEWYRTMKNEVPPSVMKFHQERVDRYQKQVDAAERGLKEPPPKERLARTPKTPGQATATRTAGTVRTFVMLKDPGSKGQAALVVDAMKELNRPATLAEITELVVKSGKLVTRQPAERVVTFYLNEFRHKQVIDVGPEVKAGESAAVVAERAAEAIAPAAAPEPPPTEPPAPKKKGK